MAKLKHKHKDNFIKNCLAFMSEVGLVTDNNINYYSPMMDKYEWLVVIWADNDIRVVNDIYIADNECKICTTNAETVKTLKEFKEKLSKAIEMSKKLFIYLKKKTIDRDFVDEYER